MRTFFGAPARDPAVISIGGALALLSVGVLSGHGAGAFAALLAAVTIVAVGHRSILKWDLKWDRLIAALLIVVLFVPIGRYRLPAGLPFDLELYRLVVAGLLLLWLSALLIDSRVRLESTTFDRPLFLIMACALASEVTNPGRVSEYGSHVMKSLTFFVSFILVYYVIATTIRRRDDLMTLLRILTVGGASIGVLAVYEQRTRYNLFDHVHAVLPFLTFEGPLTYLTLGGNIRVFGPSEQPIALGAALVLILPLAIYFARTSGRRWWIAVIFLILGAFASGSRTAMIMLAGEGIVFFYLKPTETKRLWPALIPVVVVIHFAVPGTLGSLKDAFFPKGGLIAQQSTLASDYDPLLAGGRIRQLKPLLFEASQKPLFGDGLGTRITGFNTPERNAPILDNAWLGVALEVGFVGLIAWVWLLVGAVRGLAKASRTAGRMGDDWLFAALTASVTGCAVGMLTFDAFDFTQFAFIFWIVLGVAAALLAASKTWTVVGVPAFADGHGRL